MKLADINPYIRLCNEFLHKQSQGTVYVKDCRLICPISGKGTITINDETYKLKHGTIFYCNSGSIYTLIPEQDLHIICINFDLDRKFSHINTPIPTVKLDSQKAKTPLNQCYIENSSFLNSYAVLDIKPDLLLDISNIAKEFKTTKKFYKEKASSILKCVLTDMHRIDTSFSPSITVDNIISYINDNISQPIDNNFLANIAGYHPYHLNRLFLKHTGKSMHKYIVKLRLNKAKQLLLTSELPFSEISLSVGFNNYTHFSNCFKKEFSMTPREFQKNFKNNV